VTPFKFVSGKLLTNRSCDPPWETPSARAKERSTPWKRYDL